ncbi:hypothetical protein [Lysobacter hankyongensis]|uniref:Uncharacterized protein n=1 Tax=Lysobacter hankyongensis TaxID=1176535 RepID=A0ABP9C031_9GAMM
MTFRYLFAALCLSASFCLMTPRPLQAAKPAFDGAWSVRFCDKAAPSRDCGGFWLYLVQDGDRLCGDFYAATPGLSRVDEGGGRWVLGVSTGNVASVVIESTRNNATYLATAQKKGGRLEWRLIGPIEAGSMQEAPVIPLKATMMRDTGATSSERMRQIRDAPCAWPSDAEG